MGALACEGAEWVVACADMDLGACGALAAVPVRLFTDLDAIFVAIGNVEETSRVVGGSLHMQYRRRRHTVEHCPRTLVV